MAKNKSALILACANYMLTSLSGVGTVYYVGIDSWGVESLDEKDYIEWLNTKGGNVEEVEIQFLTFAEENIGILEREK